MATKEDLAFFNIPSIPPPMTIINLPPPWGPMLPGIFFK